MKIIIFLFFTLFSLNFVFAKTKPLTVNDLNSDIQYYYRISAERQLSPNDKLYILNRIYEKYKNTNLDLSIVQQEIENVKKEQQKINVKKLQLKDTEPAKQNTDYPRNIKDDKYRISAGDILYIRVSPAEDLSREVAVTPDGNIVFPLIGKVKVEGLTTSELRQILEKNLAIYISQPKVDISVKYFSKKQVFLMGEVRNPGGYQYREGLKLFELISQAGGVTQYAGTKNIKIYRGEKEQQQILNINLEEILLDTSKDVVLLPGDIIEVPRLPKTISVIGEVNQPGSYEWYEGLDVIRAITLARGYTTTAKLSSVRIFRETSQGKTVIPVNVASILDGKLDRNITLEPGDTVYIPRKPLVSSQWFVNTVLPWLTLITTVLLLISYVK
ncbi:MAG: polysaccharide export protein [Endomicrobia bacterium]|nr:polysaccharide export protein [Endomicrobiia bacterium]MDW8056282.1 polysaccharide biosynthesis/export family protein [Elusimicrobiota bacterium]